MVSYISYRTYTEIVVFETTFQLGTGQNYNVTLNLSGLILLGLGISTSLLAYMFLSAFGDDESSSSGYGADSYDSSYDYKRRKGYRNKVIEYSDRTMQLI